jgi:gamma-glutamyltranspeptidase/glutathione hydrolase
MRPGDVGRGIPQYATFDVLADNRRALGLPAKPDAPTEGGHGHDTSQLDVIDHEGNMVSATPSGGWIPSSPVIRGLGFPLGTRGQMFYLNPARQPAATRMKWVRFPPASLSNGVITPNLHATFGVISETETTGDSRVNTVSSTR